jgi:HSP20 family protein
MEVVNMALVRWEPLREIETLQREMNRLFDNLGTPAMSRLGNGAFFPAAELSETGEAIDLKVEIPGMAPEDIDVQVSADAVAISGERRTESKTEKDGVTRSEFYYGKFERVIPLPSRVQNTSVNADYKDGILTLHLPKVEDAQNKVVKVSLS